MNRWRLFFVLIISAFLFIESPVAEVNAAQKRTAGSLKTQTSARKNIPTTVAFTRMAEPREYAFTMLIPRGWIVEGGIFRVDPNQVGGTMNSIEAKCDISIKSDAAGTVMLRRLPKINYADGPMIPPTHGPGMNYNGMLVTPIPTVDNYLMWLFRQIRPGAYDTRVVRKESLPQLAGLVKRLSEPLNRTLMQVGIRPPSYYAGFLIVEYTENGRRFKELLYTLLVDARASMALWANDITTVMRAPAEEADRWKPVLDIISNSVKLNPQWVAGELRGQGERAEISRKLMEDIARIDKEIAAHRTRTQKNIQTDQYLTLTGQNDYRNPYTGRVERDTSDWSRRWVNSSGEYIYSNDTNYNPNADPNNPRHDYKLTQPQR
jgi:hypothetical protein